MPLADRAMGTSISIYWKEIPKMHTWSSDDIIRWQNDKFRKLVKAAYENTVYYRKVMNEIGIVPSDINGLNDVRLFPMLSKHTVKAHYHDILSKQSHTMKYSIKSTGGSTGDPLTFAQGFDSWSFVTANNIVNWENNGYRYGDTFFALGSTSIHVGKKKSLKHNIYYSLKNKRAMSGINLTDDVMSKYLEYLSMHRIKFIYGYASSIYLLAKFAKQTGFQGRIKCCFPTSEVLTDQYYSAIKDAFACPILDSYGASDGSISLYNVGYNSYVSDHDDEIESMKSMLVTDVLSTVFPLINYQIGDRVELGHVSKEYNGQTIKRILGRTSEVIELDNGARITGPGFTVLFHGIPIEYYCIEKKSGNCVLCHVVPEKEFNLSHEEYIRNCIQNQVGHGVDVAVDRIEVPFLSSSGKRMYVINSSSK